MKLIVFAPNRRMGQTWVDRMLPPEQHKDVRIVATVEALSKLAPGRGWETVAVAEPFGMRAEVGEHPKCREIVTHALAGVTARVLRQLEKQGIDVEVREVAEVVGREYARWKNSPAAEAKAYEAFGIEWGAA